MSKSTPADLAVSFRSLPRRLREASDAAVPAAAIAGATATVNDALRSAAELVGTDPAAPSIAAAIDSRELRDWLGPDLDLLQSFADRAAGAIRSLADLAERD